jgi:hypothetical protein
LPGLIIEKVSRPTPFFLPTPTAGPGYFEMSGKP